MTFCSGAPWIYRAGLLRPVSSSVIRGRSISVGAGSMSESGEGFSSGITTGTAGVGGSEAVLSGKDVERTGRREGRERRDDDRHGTRDGLWWRPALALAVHLDERRRSCSGWRRLLARPVR